MMISLPVMRSPSAGVIHNSPPDSRDSSFHLFDRHGRRIDHLRLSITSACNLSCAYCRPTKLNLERQIELTDKQRLEIVKLLYEKCGLTQLRITGGEPLLHPTATDLIASIRGIAPDLQIAMTTNACLLKKHAHALKTAGLNRLNISLDSLDHRCYREVTGGSLSSVLEGIEAILAIGFPPPRINTVVLEHINDMELLTMARWALQNSMEIRFLEAMPIGPASLFNKRHFVSARQIRERLIREFELSPLPRGLGETATRFLVVDTQTGMRGTLGIIAPISERFCSHCRRMRITADGRLYPCLMDNHSISLIHAWDDGRCSQPKLTRLIRQAIDRKKMTGSPSQDTPMVQLGG